MPIEDSGQNPKPAVRDMRGYMAKNNRKSAPNHPDFRGKLTVHGKEVLLSFWQRDDNPDLYNIAATDPEDKPGLARSIESDTGAASSQNQEGQRPAAPARGSDPASGGTGDMGSSSDDALWGDIFNPQ